MTLGKVQTSKLFRMAVRFSLRSFAAGHFPGKSCVLGTKLHSRQHHEWVNKVR